MKTIELKISEAVFNKILSFLELLPKESVQIILKDDDRKDIPYVDDDEQKEIERILKNPECHKIAYKEKVIIK